MKLYKLTDENDQTFNNTQWGEGVTHETSGQGDLCGPGWIHAYIHPLLAVLLNPMHADFANPHLWEGEGHVGITDHGLKVGCTKFTTLTRMALPAITTEQRVRFAILCVKQVYDDVRWNTWADNWLSGEDRTARAAQATQTAAWAAAWEAARAAGAAAAAADAATRAADAAADATTWAATWTAGAAWEAAWSAARAAAVSGRPLDLVAIAKRAVDEES